MSAYTLCASGDCSPWTCPVCAQFCDGCGDWLHECSCPTLPLDEDDES